jgi:hypothetical protein
MRRSRIVRLKYSVRGYAIDHAASLFWAILHEKFQERFKAKNCAAVIRSALAGTPAANLVNFHVVPNRSAQANCLQEQEAG